MKLQNDRKLKSHAKWVAEQVGAPSPLPDDYDLVEHMRQGSAYKYDPTRVAREKEGK